MKVYVRSCLAICLISIVALVSGVPAPAAQGASVMPCPGAQAGMAMAPDASRDADGAEMQCHWGVCCPALVSADASVAQKASGSAPPPSWKGLQILAARAPPHHPPQSKSHLPSLEIRPATVGRKTA